MKKIFNLKNIIVIVLLSLITLLIVSKIKENQDIQNRAAYDNCLNTGQAGCFTTPCCPGLTCTNNICQDLRTMPCSELTTAYQTYCQNTNLSNTITSVPCSEIKNSISEFCSQNPVPSIRPIVTPTVVQTVKCQEGQTKCMGRSIITCRQNKWIYQKICSSGCLDGQCLK